jgi:hypothetical protein
MGSGTFQEDRSRNMIAVRASIDGLRKHRCSPAISPRLCQESAHFLRSCVMFRAAQTRAAPCIAPPMGHWYKDRAAIQATKNVRAIAGYRGTHPRITMLATSLPRLDPISMRVAVP